MTLLIGGVSPSSIYFNGSSVSAVYYNSTKVWPDDVTPDPDPDPQPVYHTVTFDANGGKFATGKTSIQYSVVDGGTVAAQGLSPTRDRYKFSRWTLYPNGDGKAYDFTTPVTSDINLYALWVMSATGSAKGTWSNEYVTVTCDGAGNLTVKFLAKAIALGTGWEISDEYGRIEQWATSTYNVPWPGPEGSFEVPKNYIITSHNANGGWVSDASYTSMDVFLDANKMTVVTDKVYSYGVNLEILSAYASVGVEFTTTVRSGFEDS